MSEMSTPLMEFSFKMLHHVEWRVHRLSPRSLRPRMKKAYLRRHDCCDQELLNIIENRRSEDLVEDKVKSEPTLGSDHSRSEVLGCKGDGF